MDPKAKKELTQQGSSVVQAVKWIGGAIFGDADDVLDEMAEHGDEQKPPPPKRVPPKRHRAPAIPSKVIDVEAFLDDEDDE